MVGLGPGGTELAFTLGPPLGSQGAQAQIPIPAALRAAPTGAVVEVSAPGAAIAGEIGRRLAAHGGAALIVDYGHAAPRFGARRSDRPRRLRRPGRRRHRSRRPGLWTARPREAAGSARHWRADRGATQGRHARTSGGGRCGPAPADRWVGNGHPVQGPGIEPS
ncbi:MAG: SAM-dependent methyltransferase [Alphaproteobacteria bacterium]